MARYATVDVRGVVTGFYQDGVSPSIPAGAVSITDLQWQQWLSNISGQAWIGSSLQPYTPPPPPSATPAQLAAAALASTVSVTSASTPALSGIYGIDATSQSLLTAVQTRINAGLGLPLGLATIQWFDAAGAGHAFTAAQFTSFAHAISDYVYQLTLIVMGQGTTLPTPSITIA